MLTKNLSRAALGVLFLIQMNFLVLLCFPVFESHLILAPATLREKAFDEFLGNGQILRFGIR